MGQFYVAMSIIRPGCGGACCVADDAETVAEFMTDYAGREIRFVDGDEMMRLMTLEPTGPSATPSPHTATQSEGREELDHAAGAEK